MTAKKIAIKKIENEDVKKAVFSALDLIGAKKLFTKSNMEILIKPNILSPKEPERAVNSHPDVFRAVVQWVKQFNPRKIIVAESSGTRKRGVTENAFKISGLEAVCNDENIEWTPFGKTPRKVYKVNNPLVMKEVPSSTLLEEVDLIINIPKIKTHLQCLLTCCIKNMFGVLILGLKAQTHARFPKMVDFNAALADIYSVSQPKLTIIDGYYCQEGNGPASGDVVKLDIILAGYDPVALDTTVCEIVEFDPKLVYHIAKAEQKGLGTSNLENIEFLGDSINSVKRKFKPPKHFGRNIPIPKKYADYIGKTVFKSSIRFKKSKCKLCATCWKNCPVDAITPPKKIIQGKTVPKRDKNVCITCYCCAELCPHEAVNFKINYVKNIFNSWLGIIGFGLAATIWLLSSLIQLWFL